MYDWVKNIWLIYLINVWVNALDMYKCSCVYSGEKERAMISVFDTHPVVFESNDRTLTIPCKFRYPSITVRFFFYG